MYSDEEINQHNKDIKRLKSNEISFVLFIKEKLDLNLFKENTDTILSIIDQNFHHSLIKYATLIEDYEFCAWIKQEYQKLIIKN